MRSSECRWVWIGAVSGWFLAVCMAWAAPRLICDHPEYDFGTKVAGEEVEHTFVLWNRGDEPVRISKVKNCCGTRVVFPVREIFPGSNAACRVILNTRYRYGEQVKRIWIASNDPKHPYYELRLKGTVRHAVDCVPRYVRLGKLSRESEAECVIAVTNRLDERIVLRSVSSTAKGVKAIVTRTGEGTWIVRVKTVPPLAPGRIRGVVRLDFSCGAEEIPISGQVMPAIRIMPKRVVFAAPLSSRAVERVVMLRSGDGSPFEVVSARLEGGEGTVETEKILNDCWRCRVSLVPARLQPGANLLIETTLSDARSVKIPFETKLPRTREKPEKAEIKSAGVIL